MIVAPTLNQSQKIWVAMAVGLLLALALTALSDWVFSGQAPNLAFYVIVFACSILGAACAMWAWSALLKPLIPWLELVRVMVGVTVATRLVMVIEQTVHNYLLAYPQFLDYLVNLVLYLVLTTALLVRLANVRRGYALLLAVIGFVGGLVLAGVVTFATGITTPGP